MIKKVVRWVVTRFRWLGRKICLILHTEHPLAISSPATESDSAAPLSTNNSQTSKEHPPQARPVESKSSREDKHEGRYFNSVIEDIPEIQNIILGYMGGEINESAGYTGSRLTLFGYRFTVRTLLQHIVRGEQDQAESMIKSHPDLLLLKGNVTDDANRTFKDITAFQAAIWPKDRHMWEMILKYLPKDEAAKQLRDHESESKMPKYVKEHGRYYDFSPLIQGLQNHFDYVSVRNIDWAVADQMWRQGVGGPQRKLPAHVVNEYCRKDRPFYPLPTFKEVHLPRTRDFFNWLTYSVCSWFSSAVDAGLGFDFAICRPHNGRKWGLVKAGMAVGWPGGAGGRPLDLAAVSRLCKVRTEELDELKIKLLNPAPSVAPR